ncbi:MAG: hypothetical protein WDW36_000719 [Sanguina aurantia]
MLHADVKQGGSQPGVGRKRINPDTVIYAEGSKPSPISDSVPSHLGHSNGSAAVAASAAAAAAAALPEAHPAPNPAAVAPAVHAQHPPTASLPAHTAAAAALLTQQAAPTAAPDVPRDVTMSGVQAGLIKATHSPRPTAGPGLGTAIFNCGPAPLPAAAPTPPPAAAHQEAPSAKRHKAESGQASGGGSQQALSASQTTLPQTSAATPASKRPPAPAPATPHTTQAPHTSLPPITPLAMFGAPPSPMPTPLGAEADSRNPHDAASPAGTSSACTTSAATAAAAVAIALGAIAAATHSGAAAAGPMSSSTDADATATPEARLALQGSLQQHDIPELLAVLAHELHLPNPVGDRQASRTACKRCGSCAACGVPAALTANELAAFVEGQTQTLAALITLFERALLPACLPAQLAAFVEGQTQTLAALITDLCALGYLAEAGAEPSVKLCMDIVNMATRKPYQESAVGSKEGTSAPVTADSEDADASRLWFWELRDPKKMLVDKPTAKLCTLYRKRRKDLAERLTAATALSDALSKALAAESTRGFDRALAKAVKARVRLEKAASVESVEATAEEGEALLRQGMKGGAQAAAMEEKSRERRGGAQAAAMEEERRVRRVRPSTPPLETLKYCCTVEARAAKEQAKSDAKAVKETEKEAGRVVKGVEKAEKQAARSGFGNTATLGKSQSVFKSFFQKATPKAVTPSPASAFKLNTTPRALAMPSPHGTSSEQPIDVDVKQEIPSIAVAYNGVAVNPSPRIQFLDESLFQEPKPSGQEVLRIFAETLLSFRAQRAKRTRTPGQRATGGGGHKLRLRPWVTPVVQKRLPRFPIRLPTLFPPIRLPRFPIRLPTLFPPIRLPRFPIRLPTLFPPIRLPRFPIRLPTLFPPIRLPRFPIRLPTLFPPIRLPRSPIRLPTLFPPIRLPRFPIRLPTLFPPIRLPRFPIRLPTLFPPIRLPRFPIRLPTLFPPIRLPRSPIRLPTLFPPIRLPRFPIRLPTLFPPIRLPRFPIRLPTLFPPIRLPRFPIRLPTLFPPIRLPRSPIRLPTLFPPIRLPRFPIRLPTLFPQYACHGSPSASPRSSPQYACHGSPSASPRSSPQYACHGSPSASPRSSPLPGVPPSWAQNKGYCLDTAKEKYLALVTNSPDPGSIRAWRRKLIQHHGSLRPAYFGSVSRVSPSVSGRRPLGLDPVLDYDVMSDEDWEEEVEGESLSQQGDDAEESDGHGRETDEEDDGRIVEDGYLSDDEGMAVGGGVGEELDADGEATMPLPGAQPHPPTHPGSRTLLDPRLQALEAAIDKARKGNRPLILCTLPTMAWDHTCGLDPSVLNLLRGSTLRHDVQITPPLPGDVQIQIQTVLPDPPPAAAAAGLAVNGSAAKGGGQAGAGGRAAAAAAAVANGAAADAAAGPSLHRHSSGGVGGGVEAAGAGGVPAGAVENGVGEGGGGAAEKAAGGTAARVRTKTEFPAAFLESLLAFLGTSPLGNINKEAAQVVSGAIRSPTGYRRCASTTTSTRTAVAGACQGGKVVLVRSASPCARIVASLRNRGLISTNHTGTPPMLTVLVPCDAGPGGLHGDSPPPGTKLAKSTVRNGIQAHATYSSKGKAAGEAGWVLNSSLDHAGPAPAPHPTPATAATASAHPPPQPHAPQGPLPLPLPAAPAPAVGSLQRLLQQHASAAPTGAAVQPPPSTAAASAAGEPEPHTLLQPVLVTGAVPVAHTSPTPAGVAPPAAVRFGAAAAPSTAAHAPPRPQADEPADYNAHGGDGGRCSMELGMQEGGRDALGSPRVSHGPALRRRGTPPVHTHTPLGGAHQLGGSLKGGCAATAAGGASKRAEVDKARSMELILRLVRQQQQRQQRQQQEQEQAPLPLLQGQPVQQQQQQQQQQGAVTGAPTTATGAGCDPVQDSTRHTPQASTPGGSHGLDTRSLPGHGAAPQPRLDTGSGLPKPGPHPFFQPGKATGSATLTPLSGPPNPCTGDSRGPGVKGGDSSHPTGNPDSHGACGVMPGAVGRCSGSGPMDADDAARTAGAAVTALSALVVESDLSSRLLYFPPGRPTSFADAALASSYWAAVACWLAHGSCQGSAHMSQGLSSLAVYSLRDEAVVGSIPPSLLTALAKTATHPRLPRHVCEDVAQSLANTIVALSRHVVQQSEVCLDATASSSRSRSRRQSRCSQAVAAAEDTPDPSIPQAGSSLHLGLDPQLNGPSGCGAGGTGGSVERDSATDDSADAGRTTLSALMLDPWFADVLQRAAVGVKQDGATPLANHLMHCTRILMQHGQDRQQQLQQQRLQQQRLQQQRQQQDTPPGSHSHPDTPHTANTHSFNQDALAPTSPPDLRSPPVLQPSATPTLEQSGCSASPSSAQQDYAESLSAAAALRRRILSDRDWSTALRRASTWKGSPPPDEQQQQQHQPPNMLTSHAVSCVGALAKDPACAEGISRWPSSYGLTLAARAVGDDVKTLYKRQAQITLLALLRVPGILQAWLPPPARSAPGPAPPLKRGFFTKAAQQQKAAPPGEDATQCLAELVQAMIRLDPQTAVTQVLLKHTLIALELLRVIARPLLLRVAVADAALHAACSAPTPAPRASKYADLPELLRDIVKELQILSQQPNEELSREAASLLQELRPPPEEQLRSESI